MQEGVMQSLWRSSLLDSENATYLENLYELYLEAPEQVSPAWRAYFAQLPENGAEREVSHANIRAEFQKLARKPRQASTTDMAHEFKQMQVLRLIHAYRLQGHLHAHIDPLEMREELTENKGELALKEYGLGPEDKETLFETDIGGARQLPLKEVCQALETTYCGSIGTEYMHIPSREERAWLQNRIEGCHATPRFSAEKKRDILLRLTGAEGLEKYLGLKFPGAKRFSLEGGEALIPLLDEMVQRAGAQGVKECVIGMAHRGRLNVLINVLGKNSKDLFSEFAGKHASDETSGDVKYHQGFSSDIQVEGKQVHLALAFNPSHLEIVTPVVAGSVRARQGRRNRERNSVLPIAVHGDASFAGQGVVMETLNMSQTRGYGIGGTVHIVINNQVGFTTSCPQDARSTLYCTDVAKVVLAPIFHVNADDPEAVVLVAQLALDYRMQFHKDVVIDLVCYRRHGHNEADDPVATQPLMYQKIKAHPTVRQKYAEQLIKEQVIAAQDEKALVLQNREVLDKGDCVIKNKVVIGSPGYLVDWSQYHSQDWREPVETQVALEKLQILSETMHKIPEGFQLHPRVAKIYEERAKMMQGEMPLDWGCAETMAYATLLSEGYAIRLSGQDSGRGTFFHRHAVLHDQKTGKTYIPLEHIQTKQPFFRAIDSLLSEEAVLGFEYGYATAEPNTLVLWEAQFGDFANGAQVVIDQFISSGEQKWGRLCGLVMLLPHGYEGQGPEHSSARLERYLQLCAQHNMQVCVPSTAAQIFHLLRRQMKRKMRKPLIVMSPKSLLRHRLAGSSLESLTKGQFMVVIPEEKALDDNRVTKVVLCSGKVYYDLVTQRDEMKKDHIAILRVEQLYPFPEAELQAQLERYPNVQEVVWCQEEPKNQGAWFSSQHHIRACLSAHQRFVFAGRCSSASPAVGYLEVHEKQQRALVSEALQ